MSPDIVPFLFTSDTGTVNKLVISVLIPTGSPTIGSQYQQSCLRCLIEGFTFVQLLYPLLTDFPLTRAFSLLTHAVQYLPLEREAPQGGLETLPVKCIRETNHPERESKGFVCEPSPIYRGSFPNPKQYSRIPLISSKVMMNQFQRTFSLIIRKILIFESALIHRRTHKLRCTTRGHKTLRGKCFL